MKEFLKILIIVAASLLAGAYIHKCQSPDSCEIGTMPGGCRADTVTYVDTITYYKPIPANTSISGYKFITLPYPYIQSKSLADTLPQIRADTEVGEVEIDAADNDSMIIKLPIVQNVYEDSTYKAYVSGVYPSLDSIFVYPRREVVTIKKPPKRWHIGPTIGYGITPTGLHPYFGVSVTYSLISF